MAASVEAIGLDAALDEIRKRVESETVDAMRRNLDELVFQIKSGWPVDDDPGPHSRDAWAAEVHVSGNEVVGELRNATPYTTEVHPPGDHTPFVESLVMPLVEATARQIAEDIDEGVGGV